MKVLKGLFIVLMSLALVGCSSGPYAGVGDDYKTGNLLLSISHTGSLQDEIEALLVPVEATHARVRLIGGEFNRNIVEDMAIPIGKTAALEIRVPIGTYEVHVVAYNQYSDSDGKKYGTALTGNSQKGVVVSEGDSTNVSMTLEKFGFTASGPTDYVKEGSDYRIRFSRTVGLNGIHFQSWSYDELMTSRYSWSGDTELALPDDLELVNPDNYVGYVYERYTKEAPNEFGATVYYQIRTALESSYQYSKNYLGGKQDLCPIYFYFPSTTYGEDLGTVRTSPLGDVNIGID